MRRGGEGDRRDETKRQEQKHDRRGTAPGPKIRQPVIWAQFDFGDGAVIGTITPLEIESGLVEGKCLTGLRADMQPSFFLLLLLLRR